MFIEKASDVQKFTEKAFNDGQRKPLNDIQKSARKTSTIKSSNSKQSSRANFTSAFTNESGHDDAK
ncbi:MAG: hypothetical protein HETSPECPRED_004126, partial [Heterodermia speciosa]